MLQGQTEICNQLLLAVKTVLVYVFVVLCVGVINAGSNFYFIFGKLLPHNVKLIVDLILEMFNKRA